MQTVPTSRSNSNQVNSAENNAFNSKSLIDFDPDPEPPQAGAMQSVPQQSNSSPAIEGGWASFDSGSPQKPPQTATDSSTLESTLVQLSAPSSSAPAPNFSTMTANAVNSFPKANNGGQWPTLQQHQQLSLFPDSNGQANNPLLATPVVTTQNNQVTHFDLKKTKWSFLHIRLCNFFLCTVVKFEFSIRSAISYKNTIYLG